MSGDIFARIAGRAIEEGYSPPDADAQRWIARHSDADATLMSRGEVKTARLSKRAKALFVAHENRAYVAFVGFPPTERRPEGLEPIELTPGIFALVVTEADLAPSASAAESLEVLGESSNTPGYAGHSLWTVANLFTPIRVFDLNRAEDFSGDIYRVIGIYGSASYSDGALEIDESTLFRLEQHFRSGPPDVPYPLVLQGMLSFSWETFFLEVYRCLEQVYAYPRVKELAAALPSEKSIYDLAKLLETRLGWRAKEDESLAKIFQLCDISSLREAYLALHPQNEEIEVSADIAAKAVYKLRNDCVHFRPATDRRVLSPEVWNLVIRVMIGCVEDVYSQCGSFFYGRDLVLEDQSLAPFSLPELMLMAKRSS